MTSEEKEELRQLIREELAALDQHRPFNQIKTGNCPPKFGTCPIMFLYIPAGQSVICSGCGQEVHSSAPTFSITN